MLSLLNTLWNRTTLDLSPAAQTVPEPQAHESGLIVTDHPSKAERARQILTEQGLKCTVRPFGPLLEANNSDELSSAALLLVVLPDPPDKGLELIQRTRRAERPLLCAGPGEDPGLILQSLRAGVDRYLDLDNLESDLGVALTTLGKTWGQPKGKNLVVLAPNGGSGASTVLVNLGIALAQHKIKVQLIDLHWTRNDLTWFLDLKPSFTLATLCEQQERLDRAMFDRAMTTHSSGVSLLASGGPHSRPDVLEEGITQIMEWSQSAFHYVLVDMENSHDPITASVLKQADEVLVVFRLDFVSLKNLQNLLDHFSRLGIAKENVRIVANQQDLAGQLSVERAEQALGISVSQVIPHDPRAANQAINHGAPAMLEQPRSKLTRSIQQLAQSVLDR